MATETDPRITAVLALYESRGGSAYFGEKVSKTDHMVQAASSAEAGGESERVVLASLLHDIGHLLEQDDMNGLGVRDHGRVGAEYLRSLGMDAIVCEMVARHADAKRYLVTTRTDYSKRLSPASRRTLLYQGGRMSKMECGRFEQLACFRGAIQVRVHDDCAKETGVPARGVASFVPLIRKYFAPAAPPPLDSPGRHGRVATGIDRTRVRPGTSS